MNQMYNPLFLARIAHTYLSDINRLYRYNDHDLKTYQGNCLQKMVHYAYSVPAYYQKYKSHHVHPRDICSIDDIQKLPLMTKSDLMDFYPDGITPPTFNRKNGFLKSTSGSTGIPVSVYCDLYTTVRNLIACARILNFYGGHWYRSKIAQLIDLGSGTLEQVVFTQGAAPNIHKLFTLNNIVHIHKYGNEDDIINQLNTFQPEFLLSDPQMLQKFAQLKQNDHCIAFNPCYLFSSCDPLDRTVQKQIEKAFNVPVIDCYGATETGPIAYQCIHGEHYHVDSDFLYIEIVDTEGNPVNYGEQGEVVVTKLYGGGTPIIRYTGLDDCATLIQESCISGITTQMIHNIKKNSSITIS